MPLGDGWNPLRLEPTPELISPLIASAADADDANSIVIYCRIR